MLESCFTCNQPVSERARFCGKCGANIRCRTCGEDLHGGDIACEMCGTKVATNQDQPQNNAVNHIIYSDSKKGINLEAKVTDTFGANTAAIVGMIGGRQVQMPLPVKPAKSIPGQKEIFEPAEVVSEDEDDSFTAQPVQAALPLRSTPTIGNITLRSLFEERDGEWFFTNPNLKPKNKLEFVKRATCLYLQMQYDLGNKVIPKIEIKRLLDNYSAYDANTRRWFKSEHTLLRVTTNDLSIIFPGTQFVSEILAELNDDSIVSKWKVGTTRKAAKKIDKKDIEQSEGQE